MFISRKLTFSAVSILALSALGLFLQGAKTERVVNRWASSGSMSTARSAACSALLPDGRVMVTGGRDAGNELSTAEFYNTYGAFSEAPMMSIPRADHACVALADGTILVAGGTSGRGTTNSAELFDPATNSWSVVDGMTSARAGATFTRLADGRVLFTGGEASGVPLSTLEIYDPAARQFSNVSSVLSSPRKDHAAAMLRDGRILIAGGTDGNIALDTADLFDPSTNSVHGFGKMTTARDGLSATLLANGLVILAGGSDGKKDLSSTDLFNPFEETFAPGPSMDFARRDHQALLIPRNNTVMMVGGTAKGEPLVSAERFIWWDNNHQGRFTRLEDMTTALSQATAAVTESGVVVLAGGKTRSGALSASANATANTWIQTDKPDYQPGNSVYLSGGLFAANDNITVTITVQYAGTTTYVPVGQATTFSVDVNGVFSGKKIYDVVEADLGATFHVIAMGSSGATASTTFTDARNWTLTFAGTGSGSVVITPSTGTINAPISCGGTGSNATSQTVTGTCSPNITTSGHVATVTFNASAAGGSTFAGWTAQVDLSGPSTCSGTTNPCSAVLGPSAALTVTFNGLLTTSLSVAPASGTYGGTAALSATLTSGVTPVNGKTINFTLNGSPAGSAVTNASGVASIAAASLSGINAGTYPGGAGTGVGASFAGDASFALSSDTDSLTVNKAPLTITANNRTKTYGDAVVFAGTEFTAGAMVAGDSVTSVTLTSAGAAATATVAGSTYPIVASAAVGVRLDNYLISY
ncbi:MAG: hypothetical protein JJE04_09655, partial [Acidobacteriia bacterium]|nr:hypothetical protein [Terriglobia bacterium]